MNGHAVTFWTYLPQPEHPVEAQQLAKPLHALHTLGSPPLDFPEHDYIRAIRRSLADITCLPAASLRHIEDETDRLEEQLHEVQFALAPGLTQGDPQHRNALHTTDGGAVLCDWDTIACGQPEWDLVTVEVHCRRFGFGRAHYGAFAEKYGWDVTAWPGYQTLRDIRELRMITTNARKVHHAPGPWLRCTGGSRVWGSGTSGSGGTSCDAVRRQVLRAAVSGVALSGIRPQQMRRNPKGLEPSPGLCQRTTPLRNRAGSGRPGYSIRIPFCCCTRFDRFD